MTVRQLLASLDSREISEWHACFRIEAEEAKRATLDARASQGVKRIRARGR